jgi:hypothetical protein
MGNKQEKRYFTLKARIIKQQGKTKTWGKSRAKKSSKNKEYTITMTRLNQSFFP